MSSTLKLRMQKSIDNGDSHLRLYEAGSQHKAVCVIVLSGQTRKLHIPAMCGAHTLVLVHSHANAVSAATDGNSRVHLAGLERESTWVSKVRIVARLCRIRSKIFICNALRVEPTLNNTFKFISGMVAA